MSQCVFVLLLTCVCACYGAKLLVVFPVPAGSHRILGEGFVTNLLQAGHEVTYITPFPIKESKNLRVINVNNTFEAMTAESLSIDLMMKKEVEMVGSFIFYMMLNVTERTLWNKDVQKLVNDPKESFDVVIAERMFNDIYSGFSAVFNCPFIWSFSYEPTGVVLGLIDEASNPAYTIDIESVHMPPFTFTQRVQMLWLQIVSTVASVFYYRNFEKDLYQRAFGPVVTKKGRELPSYEDIRVNASLILANTHVSLGTSSKFPQSLKSIGGYHIDPDVKPLPDELKKIMDNAKDGVIYFSMGSNLNSKDFSKELKKSLIDMFSKLKQTVLWKFEESFPDLPKNVHVLKWAPQQSILAHDNCVLFITHGGLLSTTEAVHFGVPVLGIPVFFDQPNNIERAVRRGFGKRLTLSYQLAQDLKDAIVEMTGNPKYRQKVKELSYIYHHRPVPPGKELVHWVEHVVATRGAPHLRSPALLLPWYQKMYLDLAAVMVVLMLALKRFIAFQNFTSKRNRGTKKKYA